MRAIDLLEGLIELINQSLQSGLDPRSSRKHSHMPGNRKVWSAETQCFAKPSFEPVAYRRGSDCLRNENAIPELFGWLPD